MALSASLKALLSGVIDYAGLFPPAKLPLPEALANHLHYRQGADAWMLGRFICPAGQLRELPGEVSLSCSVLARGGDTEETFLAGLAADLAEIAACRERHGGGVVIDVLEVKLPPSVTRDESKLRSLLTQTAEMVKPAGLGVFFEASVGDNLLAFRLLWELRDLSRHFQAGFKFRAGGLEANAFPSSEDLAKALVDCLYANVPFKATAGLHHPFPRYDAGVGVRMHGFINLFVAGVLVRTLGIGADIARAVLKDENPAHFRFAESGLRWHELEVLTEEIAAARQKWVLSFGSCSFDEPRDDLRQLGWL